MTDAEARAVIALLKAAFPRQTLEQETVDLYAAELTRLGSTQAASMAVKTLVEGSIWFPTVAEIVTEYRQALRRIEADRSHEHRQITAGEATWTPDPNILREMRQRSRGGAPKHDPLSEVAPQPSGRCDDCHDQTLHAPRYQIGRLTVCAGCASSRLKVRQAIAAALPEKPADPEPSLTATAKETM